MSLALRSSPIISVIATDEVHKEDANKDVEIPAVVWAKANRDSTLSPGASLSQSGGPFSQKTCGQVA